MINYFMTLALSVIAATTLFGDIVDLKDGENAAWRRELLPLPHELAIAKIQRLKPSEIGIRGRAGAAGLEQISVSNVVELFREKTGIAPDGKGFEILIGVMDDKGKMEGINVPQGARLKEVPSRDQAYVIQPVGEKQLVVAALSDRGLYYGTRTLSQWLELHLNKETAEIPLASVVDWPDLQERGFIHMPLSLIPWLASMKLNRFFACTWFSVSTNGVIKPIVDTYEKDPATHVAWVSPYSKARLYAAEVLPGPSHMDMWLDRCPGFINAYPELAGKGDAAKAPRGATPHQRVLCATNPKLVTVLAEVFQDLAAQGAGEFMLWTSECSGHCGCEACLKEGQFHAEVRSAVEAWRQVCKQYPNIKLSVFFGLGGGSVKYPEEDIARMMSDLPSNVVLRTSGGLSKPAVDAFAAAGHPVVSHNVTMLSWLESRYISSEAQRCMMGLLKRYYQGANQYTYDIGTQQGKADIYRKALDFRLSALAEFGWNAGGRTPREFAEAWATRRGCTKPVDFGKWTETLETPELRGLAGHVRAGWGVYTLPDILTGRRTNDVAAAGASPELQARATRLREASALTDALDDPDVKHETKVLVTYDAMERAAGTLARCYWEPNAREKSGKAGLRQALADFNVAMKAYREAVEARNNYWQLPPAMTAALNKSFVPAEDLRQRVEAVVNQPLP